MTTDAIATAESQALTVCLCARRLLLRVAFRVVSTLRLKRCRCVELLLDARLNSQPLLGLSDLRGTTCRSRDRSLAEAAGGER